MLTTLALLLMLSSPSHAEQRPTLDLRANLHAAVCQDRTPCTLSPLIHDAGLQGDVAIHVAEVVLKTSWSDWRRPSKAGCVPVEVWVVYTRGVVLERATRLLKRCIDGLGPDGWADLKVGQNHRLAFVTHDTTPEVITREEIWQLRPLRLLEEQITTSSDTGAMIQTTHWRWDAFRGTVRRALPKCKTPDTTSTMAHTYTLVPEVRVNAAFLKEEWRTTSLGSCSLTIDGTAQRGHLIHGPPGIAEDATMRLVWLGKRTLLVEIDDDQWHDGERTWLYDDHLELWLSHAPSACVDAKAPLYQFGIRVTDGAVFHALGTKGTFPLVERVSVSPNRVRLKIFLPKPLPTDGFTVVYSDSDKGHRQDRLIGTSALKFRDAGTLGERFKVASQRAWCRVHKGRLERVLRRFVDNVE